ncbi:MAG TPA: arylamine N-acetyltransferase [Burkholderiaceae bacterium]|jgi:N-hydroxyarylamine O-acetyltransferase|nr:arylamine N-acetyltransferase [Burkholderiaceae bacterium]
MSAAIDLDAYFTRIGCAVPRAATPATLRAIVLAHVQAIPFENLDPFLRRPPRLDAQALQAKLVRGGRGGYCFEHNLLLAHVLRALGFRVTALAARVLWNVPPDAQLPRTHMLLAVEVERAPHLVDVGFGGPTPTGALRLEPDVVQPTPHEPYRLLADGAEYVLQAQVRGEWRGLYRFDLQPQTQADVEMAHWYLCHHPQSRFLLHLVAARVAGERRLALLDDQFAVHRRDGTTERRTLANADAVRAVLQSEFGLTLPAAADLDDALARVVRRG